MVNNLPEVCALCLVLLLSAADGFNLDLLHPIVYQSNEPSEYFGYSVALHPGDSAKDEQPWVMVGAPKANDSSVEGSELQEAGKVFRCMFKQNCTKMNLRLSEHGGKRNFHRAMLGGSMDMTKERFVVCSPNLNEDDPKRSNETVPAGACYWGESNVNSNREFLPFVPIIDIPKDATLEANFPRKFVRGGVGISTHLTKDNLTGASEMMIGAPLLNNYFGSTLTYNDSTEGRVFGKGPYITGPNPNNITIKNKTTKNNETEKDALFGFAITSGQYFSKEIYTVAAAPRSSTKGKVFGYRVEQLEHVYLRSGKKSYFLALRPNFTLSGGQEWEYFGASLATGDLNGDGFDDLVIGAPFYSQKMADGFSHNEGRVIVYLGSVKGTLQPPTKNHNIEGHSIKGNLGTTVACVGDIDQDGFDDFALAAPYEGSGVVYLYVGTKEGLILSQTIKASELGVGQMSGFGYGISRGQDVDRNGYPDFAVGAYRSGHVVIFRSKPVIQMTPSIKILENKLHLNATQLKTEICMNYTGRFNLEAVDVKIILTMDPKYKRIHEGSGPAVNTTKTLVFIVNASDPCKRINFTLKFPAQNITAPIKITGNFSLVPKNIEGSTFVIEDKQTKGDDKFNSSCPVLKGNVKSHERMAEIGYYLGCEKEHQCLAKLSLNAMLTNSKRQNMTHFVIGSQEDVFLQVNLTNSGDPSFNTKLEINVPSIHPEVMPPGCHDASTETKTMISCNAGNPLGKNETRRFRLQLGKVSEEDHKNIQVTARAVSDTKLAQSAVSTVIIPLQTEASLSIFGIPQAGISRFDIDNDEKHKRKTGPIVFSYQVEKNGTTPLQDVRVEIDIPFAHGEKERFLLPDKITVRSKAFYCDWVNQNFQEESIAKSSDLTPESFIMTEDENATRNASEVGRSEHILVDSVMYPTNRTLFVNCSSQNNEFRCFQMVCSTQMTSLRQSALLELELELDMSKLKKKLGKRDFVIFGTTASVTTPGNHWFEELVDKNPDTADLSAILQRSIPPEKVQLWMIAVSALGGILLLLIATAALAKAGFFKRKKREELKVLKRQTQLALTEEAIAMMIENSRDPTEETVENIKEE